jgi:hypothetical protein
MKQNTVEDLVQEYLSQIKIMQLSTSVIRKLGRDQQLLDDIASGKNPHKFYRLKPSRIVLFDTKNFPDVPRQEYNLNV